MNQQNQRPGVYSSYRVISRYGTPRSRQRAGLICQVEESLVGQRYPLASAEEAAVLLEAGSLNRRALLCCQLLFAAGVSGVVLAGAGADCEAAAALLETEEDLGAVLADAVAPEDLLAVRDSVVRASERERERLCFFGVALPEQALAVAEALNHQRAVVVTPEVSFEGQSHALFGACALAGQLLAVGDPSYNLNGLELPLVEVTDRISEELVQRLLIGGVCVLESLGGVTQCIRGLTSCTKVDGMEERSYRSINTMLIVDDVLVSLRGGLKKKLAGVRTTVASMESVASQVLVELLAKKAQGHIEDCQLPRVYPHPEDPTICVVEAAFTVAHVVSQIWLKAEIRL